MEFLRLGGQIPGAYHGCCAIDVIQNFSVDPDAKYSMQIVHGDSGTNLGAHVGPTYKDIFLSRIRIGTFSKKENPCRGFIAVFSANQLGQYGGENPKKWLAILKENGFEFIRAVHNSVYGDNKGAPHIDYIFGLFRNIGPAAIPDPFAPPELWTTLPEAKSQQELWDAGKTVFMTEQALRDAGAPVMQAGKVGTPPKRKDPTLNKAPVNAGVFGG